MRTRDLLTIASNIFSCCTGFWAWVYRTTDRTRWVKGRERETSEQSGGGWVSTLLSLKMLSK